MKKLWIILGMMLLGSASFAQQDAMYSQYMFNPLSVNPAYAGSRGTISGLLLMRRQWLGIPGAPATETFQFHMPTPNKRYGFGINVINDHISYLSQTWVNASYAFRIPVGPGTMALGLQGSVNNYRINWDRAELIDPLDPIPATYGRQLLLPNAGTGLWYNTDRWYAGISIPHLLINSLDSNEPGISIVAGNTNLALLKRHVFIMGGYVFDLGTELKFKPSILYKYVQAAPMEVDLNASFMYRDRFVMGGSYRSGDGIVLMAQYLLDSRLRIGYAYDYPFTDLGRYTSGTHEVLVGFDFKYKKEATISPRFF